MLRKIALYLIITALCCVAASAQTADEVINKHIQARGGLEKLKAVKSFKATGKLIQGGQELAVVLLRKRPESMRMELSIQGKTFVQGYDGSVGWVLSPFSGSLDAEKMSEEQVRVLANQVDFDGPLVDYKAKGNGVELIGKDDVDGSECYKFKITRKNGDISYIYIDAENFLEVKTTDKIKQQGSEIEVDTYQANYKTLNGMALPYAVEGKVKGQTAYQVAIDTIELDTAMDDGIFHIPAKAATPAK
jgi:hypothetical protein